MKKAVGRFPLDDKSSVDQISQRGLDLRNRILNSLYRQPPSYNAFNGIRWIPSRGGAPLNEVA